MNHLLHPTKAVPQVTLVAVTSVNLSATVAALEASMGQINFGSVKLLSDICPRYLPKDVDWIEIKSIKSSHEYSHFILFELAGHIKTSHCLIIQWDGHVINGDMWSPRFLDYDYIGASWPQFSDDNVIGNGGFSLRSIALLKACRHPSFIASHPEDVAICRHNRSRLEAAGLRFAPLNVADQFSVERSGSPANSFGYHGVWHMLDVIGDDAFWRIYSELDELTALRHDFFSILWQVFRGRNGLRRTACLVRDRAMSGLKSKRPPKPGAPSLF